MEREYKMIHIMPLPFHTNEDCISFINNLCVDPKYIYARRALLDGLTLVLQCIDIYIVYTQRYGVIQHAIYVGALSMPRFTLYALDCVNPRDFIGYADFFAQWAKNIQQTLARRSSGISGGVETGA
jgi:hypothetical protein